MMKDLSFISQKINQVPLALFFDENQDLVFISIKNDYFADVQKKFKNVTFNSQFPVQKAQLIFQELESYLQKKLTQFSFDYKLIGTDFQIKVWNELNEIKYGEIISYSEVAQKINRPQAVRAVATAIGVNPIAIVVPCHRVNGKDHQLHGYGGGLELKQRLQALEFEKEI